jgi:dTDP-4-dehydrorhamnose reductase
VTAEPRLAEYGGAEDDRVSDEGVNEPSPSKRAPTVKGIRVWVPGGGGLLGQAMMLELQLRGIDAVATGLEVDITSAEAVRAAFAEHQPTHVVNCAAYAQVDDAEKDEAAALAANGEGPGILARGAREHGAAFVHFSTDYVFDGRGTEPYPVDAPCAPASAYGRTKRVGEERVLEVIAQGLRGYIIRTSWLFGVGGKNFVSTMLELMAKRPELRVVHDQRGRPTYAPDLAAASLDLAGIDTGLTPAEPGLYHFANAGAVSWFEFARRIAERARELDFPLSVERLLPCTTAEFPRPAPRPAWSVLDTTRIERALGRVPRHHALALDEYLEYLWEHDS